MRSTSTDAEAVLVVGRGRLGASLARALRDAGRAVTTTSGRAPRASLIAAARIVVIAVPDPALAGVAARIAPALARRAIVLHVAGGQGSGVLEVCRAAGARIGAMHPLVSFASARRAPPLAGSTFVIDGDRAAVRVARDLARSLGARPLVLPLHGPAYHALAALLANGAAALAAIAVDALVTLGSSRRDAERASGALLASVAANVASIGVPGALTGPIVRGDAGSVARHREALARLDPAALAAYDAIAPAILDVARRAGLEPGAALAIRRALDAPARSPRARGAPGRR